MPIATPDELFKRYAPRFSKIELLPAGFLKDDMSKEVLGLFPSRNGKRLHITYFECNLPSINLREADIRFSMEYAGAASAKAPYELFRENSHAGVADKLKGRIFHIRPTRPFSWELGADTCRRITIELEGDPISGLSLGENMSGHWSVFIPPDSPEHTAINQAVSYHRMVSTRMRSLEIKRLRALTQSVIAEAA